MSGSNGHGLRRRGLLVGTGLALLLASCGDRDPLLFPATAELRVVGPETFEGPAGLPLDTVPVVQAVDGHGNPAPGVEVEFEVVEGDGAVSPNVVLTGEQGLAQPDEWVLDPVVGENVLVAEVPGAEEVEFSAQGVPGPPAELERAGGHRQEAAGGSTLPEPVEVQVRDQFGNPVPDVDVTFQPVAESGSTSPETTATDQAGLASTTWTLGPGDDPQRLQAVTETGASTAFAANTALFIDLVFVETEGDPTHHLAFEEAALQWESVMTGGLSPVPLDLEAGECGTESPPFSDLVEDLVIFVTLRGLPSNILGQAGPCIIRTENGLPVAGLVMLNTVLLPGMEEDGTLDPVILHEIGHVLGFGTLWSLTLDGQVIFDFLRDPALPDNEDADPHFDGPTAISEFDASGGFGYEGGKVPVENDFERFEAPAGSLDSHWRMSVFGNELMVGMIDPNAPDYPLSSVTIGSLEDLGYDVALDEADPYSVAAAMQLPAPVAPVELGDDIYRGPIGVVDEDGRRVREFRPAPPFR